MINVFTGKNGTLTTASDPAHAAESADYTAIVTAYSGGQPADGQPIARLTNIEVYVQTDLEEFHEIGRRHAVSLHPGDVHIHGKIGRAYVSGAMLYLLMGRGAAPKAEPYVQPVFNMNVKLSDPANPGQTAELDLSGVKLQNWVQSIPEEGFVMENVTFRALTIHVVDTPTVAEPTFP